MKTPFLRQIEECSSQKKKKDNKQMIRKILNLPTHGLFESGEIPAVVVIVLIPEAVPDIVSWPIV